MDEVNEMCVIVSTAASKCYMNDISFISSQLWKKCKREEITNIRVLNKKEVLKFYFKKSLAIVRSQLSCAEMEMKK
jgi:hypothetical protein